jgi:predicted amidohydrolase YtcJ
MVNHHAGAEATPPAIFHARRVVTMGGFEASALAVTASHIAAVGERSELLERFPGSEVVDLGEAVIAPGFNDAHIHLAMTTDDLLHVDLSASEVTTVAEAQRRLREEAARMPPGLWIQGARYDDSKMESGRDLDRWELDAATSEHPVLVMQVAGHWGVVNSRALALAGIDEVTPVPSGGAFGRDASGHLNGILYEQALSLVTALIPPHALEDRLRAMGRAVQLFHSAGLTSIGEAYADPADVQLFREGVERDLLTLRVNVLVGHEHYDAVRTSRAFDGIDPERLRFDGVKAFVDGAIGGRTCLLTQPFEGSTDNYGIQTTSTEDLRDIVRQVHERGDRVGVHANGDRAIAILFDQYEAAQTEMPRPELHHRIEHCTIVNEDLLARIARVGAIPVPFGSYVHYYGAKLLEWYGEQRVGRMFAHRSFLARGIPVLGSSDYPCGPYQPLLALQSCVTRQGYDGTPVGANQRITPSEALSLYTVAPAEASGEGQRKGRLVPGSLADFVVLGDDPLTTPPEQLGAIPVLATYVGGRKVWSA